MTFEEFFLKKKIDLKLLAKKEPELFVEFWLHFAEMGEKSFDHTKKYLFNKLRHQYPLQEADVPVSAVAAPASPAAPGGAAPANATAGPGQAPPAEKSASPGEKAIPKESSSPAPSTAKKPAGFNPRFAAARKKTGAEAKHLNSQAEPGGSQAASQKSTAQPEKPAKPAYKPRFKPGMVKTKQAKPEAPSADSSIQEEGLKPATPPEKAETPAEEKAKVPYKPRFRPGITKRKDK